LKSLGLVEGVPGPRGGYEPTDRAVALLDRDPDADREPVTVTQEFDRVDATVENIPLTNVNHPSVCRAWIDFQTPLPDLSVGDPIIVGPTAKTALVIAGEVHSTNDTGNRVSLSVSHMEAPLSED
jgi:predicted transcriptional regulator